MGIIQPAWAPAATNAIFNAVDARAQHMSITREVLRKAMAKA